MYSYNGTSPLTMENYDISNGIKAGILNLKLQSNIKQNEFSVYNKK